MLYTHMNARSVTVRDVDTGEVFECVLKVSTSGGWIKVHDNPVRIDAQGRIAGLQHDISSGATRNAQL
jgi:hypothetical protein